MTSPPAIGMRLFLLFPLLVLPVTPAAPRKRAELECQNMCHLHCKSRSFYYLTGCDETSWGCLAGCAHACAPDGDIVSCRSRCVDEMQTRCDTAGCKAGCRRGVSRRYKYLADDEEDLPPAEKAEQEEEQEGEPAAEGDGGLGGWLRTVKGKVDEVIDANNDGKVSKEEQAEFDKQGTKGEKSGT